MTDATPRWHLVVHPELLGTHQWGLFAAMSALADRGKATIEFKRIRPAPYRASMTVSVNDASCNEERLVVFDLHDGVSLDPWAVENADVIFKRGFTRELGAATEEAPSVAEVRPFGLSIHCRAPRSGWVAARSVAELGALVALRRYPISMRKVLASARAVADAAWVSSTGRPVRSVPELIGYYEAAAPRVLQTPRVTFLVKAWDPSGLNEPSRGDFHAATEQRAELIRALRAQLGSRFVGGFVASEYASRNYPDCIANVPTSSREFISAVAQGGIGVSTRGLANSNPWKLAEYLATGCAIVTEPLHYEVPEPFKERENILSFDSPLACAERCENLIEDEGLREHMRDANRRYWVNYVRPDRLLAGRLVEAFE